MSNENKRIYELIANNEVLYRHARRQLSQVCPDCGIEHLTDECRSQAATCDCCSSLIGASAPKLKEWWDVITDVQSDLLTAEQILSYIRQIGDEDEIDWNELASDLLD